MSSLRCISATCVLFGSKCCEQTWILEVDPCICNALFALLTIYQPEVIVMDPTARWRRVNWFALTQPSSFPRLWRFTDNPSTDESTTFRSVLLGDKSTNGQTGNIPMSRELSWNHLGIVEEGTTKQP